MTTMNFSDLEIVYESVAKALDRAGPEKHEIFLAKLVLMLANELGDAAHVSAAIETCLADL